MKWILVPIDFSEDSQAALKMADNEAEWLNTGLILLHVCDLKSVSPMDMDRLSEKLLSLKRLLSRIPDEHVLTFVEKGKPEEIIVKYALDYQVRFIFVGMGGKGRVPGHVALFLEETLPNRVKMITSLRRDVPLYSGES